MATIDFKVWASSPSADVIASSNLDSSGTGNVAGSYIYANIFNGILKDLSLTTVALINALIDASNVDASSMVFNNSQSLNTIRSNIYTLLSGLQVSAADVWSNSVGINVADNSESHTGPTQLLLGDEGSITLKLPTAITADIVSTGTSSFNTAKVASIESATSGTPIVLSGDGLNPNADNTIELGTSNLRFKKIYAASFEGNATSATNATYIRKTNTSPSSTTKHYLAAFTTSGTMNSSAVQVLENLTYTPNTNTLATNISGNAATSTNASKAEKVSIYSIDNCAATNYPQNYVTISGEIYPNNVPAVYTVTMVKQTGVAPTRYGVLDTFTVKHYGSGLYTTSRFAITDVEAGYIYIFRLKFSTITDSSNYTATLQYSEDGGNTFADTGNELILRVDRQVCY